MASIKDFVIAFILVGVFIFAAVSFGNQFQLDMGANQSLLNQTQSQVNQTHFNQQFNISDARSVANVSMIGVKGEQFETTGGEITYRSIPKTTLNFWGVVSGTWKIVANLLISTLDISTVVIIAIATIIAITLIYYLWKNVRTGT